MGHKYPLLKPDEVINALSKRGFQYRNRKGSHAKYSNGYRTAIVPIHDEIARGTLKSILIQADIKLEDFLKLL